MALPDAALDGTITSWNIGVEWPDAYTFADLIGSPVSGIAPQKVGT
jgi:hypothetical protein